MFERTSPFFYSKLELRRLKFYNSTRRKIFVEQETSDCLPVNDSFKVESLSFADIPNQSKLFIEYQNNPRTLAEYYPNAVKSHADIAGFIPEVLENYKADRNAVCDALEEMNRKFGAGEKTLENINLLRETDCVAVVTGQQAGLFSGPLYTIYKALSAVKMSECLRGRGFKAVPVFWIASEDHDFDEVSKAFAISKKGNVEEFKNEPQRDAENIPVGFVKLDDSIRETVEKLFDELPQTEFTGELKKNIREIWKSGESFSDAFILTLSRIFEKYGLIMLDPLDENLKKIAAPIYVEAIKKSGEIVEALMKRSAELTENGFHAQVLVTDDYFPLFWQAKDKTRNSLKKSKTGNFRIKESQREFTIEELAEIAAREPQRFSPTVVLRAAVQDYILPTVCYFGGGAEVAYFAQSGEVYRILNRPQTPIFHRQSFTIIEAKHRRTMEKYDLNFKDLLGGKEKNLPTVVERFLNPEMTRIFAEAEKNIDAELNLLNENLTEIEPTLAESLATRRRKIVYHIENIRNKFHHAQVKKDETINRRIDTLFEEILPHKALQERTINVLTFLNLYGFYFTDWIYDAIDLDDKGHRIIYL